MSLSIYLKSQEDEELECFCECCGHQHTVKAKQRHNEFCVTHNLTDMADALGIYEVVWRPEENSIKYAKDMIPYLEEASKKLDDDPEKYKKYNPESGWGTFECFVVFIVNYLAACKEHPEAIIEASR